MKIGEHRIAGPPPRRRRVCEDGCHRRNDRNYPERAADPAMDHSDKNLIRRHFPAQVQHSTIYERRQSSACWNEKQERHHVWQSELPDIEFQRVLQNKSEADIGQGQTELRRHGHADAAVNPSNREVNQNRRQENERRKGDILEEQRETQTIVRAPQGDPETIEFVPLCQEVQREIDGDECCACPPKPGANRSQACPRPVRPERHVMRIHEGHFHPRL